MGQLHSRQCVPEGYYGWEIGLRSGRRTGLAAFELSSQLLESETFEENSISNLSCPF